VGIIFRLQGKIGDGGGLIVDEVIKGSPTDRQGQIRPEFQLVAIDEQDVRGMTPRQIAPLILGPPGSDVTLSFLDPAVGGVEGSGGRPPVRTFDVRRGWTMK
jgi:C-terminal processing protease CtpA/Prc